MKCIECGTEMKTTRENAPFKALPGTVLVGVEVSRCPKCGSSETAIPAMDTLVRMLAGAVIRKRARLNGDEVRFLRKYLGYSSADFAKRIGSSPSTVSKWENGVQPIGLHSDLLLRAMVALDKKVDAYTSDEFVEISDTGSKRSRYAFAPTPSKKWKSTELEAA
jgi:putative zinc finger/helix-turn-helix YgiT family protein